MRAGTASTARIVVAPQSRAPAVAQNDRATVRAEAVAAAHSPTANLDAKSFVNSQIPAQYTNGSLAQRRSAERAASL